MGLKDGLEKELQNPAGNVEDTGEPRSDFRAIAKAIDSVAEAIQWLAFAVIFSGTLSMCSQHRK